MPKRMENVHKADSQFETTFCACWLVWCLTTMPKREHGATVHVYLFCLWVGALCLMTLLTKAAAQSVIRQSDANGEPLVR
jgi:hypothetical protein